MKIARQEMFFRKTTKGHYVRVYRVRRVYVVQVKVMRGLGDLSGVTFDYYTTRKEAMRRALDIA